MKTEIIMTIGAEGGSINLVGARPGGNWQFRIETSDQSWMLEDDDYTPPVHPWVSTWTEALAQLDRYPWAKLHPVHVHPEFRVMVTEELQKKTRMGVRVNWANWEAALAEGS